jgi:hypothetical protein
MPLAPASDSGFGGGGSSSSSSSSSHNQQTTEPPRPPPSPLDLAAAAGLRANFFLGQRRTRGNILAVVVVLETAKWISPPKNFEDRRQERLLGCSIQLLPASLGRQEANNILERSLAYNDGRERNSCRPVILNAYAVDAILGEHAPPIEISSAPSPAGLQMSKRRWKLAQPKQLETSNLLSQNTWRYGLRVSTAIANTAGKKTLQIIFRIHQAGLPEQMFKMAIKQGEYKLQFRPFQQPPPEKKKKIK